MCGIFGAISNQNVHQSSIVKLALLSRRRGLDSSGLIYYNDNKYFIEKADFDVKNLIKSKNWFDSKIVFGHSRLITNGLLDNQPVIRDNVAVLHNGIIVNEIEAWAKVSVLRTLKIDTEIINAITIDHINKQYDINSLPIRINDICKGTISTVIFIPQLGKLLLFSNNGSLYYGVRDKSFYFSSEKYFLETIKCTNINQVNKNGLFFDIPNSKEMIIKSDQHKRKEDLIPDFKFDNNQARLLMYDKPSIIRCTRCILPAPLRR